MSDLPTEPHTELTKLDDAERDADRITWHVRTDLSAGVL